MIKFTEVLEHVHHHDGVLNLPFEKRQKSRLLCKLDDGREVGLMLPRGTVLRGGNGLKSEQGVVVEVRAAVEKTSYVTSHQTLLLKRAAYHLGNRHVPLEITEQGLRYLHDHVLDDMVKLLGLSVVTQLSPFEPESGAYGGGHHHHHDQQESHAH